MSNIKKKIVAMIIGLSMVAMMSPGLAQGATLEELTALIAELTQKLAEAQAQLAELTGEAPAITGCTITSFDRNLKQGMTGDDVKCLQIVLNSDAATQVAATGVGSSGNETTYFGPLTKAAVIKFQETYAEDVLASYGLTTGTGFVGLTTRAKLNSLLAVVTPPAGVVCGNGTCETGETTANCPADCPVAAPVAAGLTVALAADTPAATTLVADTTSGDGAQALASVLKLKLSTPTDTTAKVTTLKIKRAGISADADVSNMYLYDGDTLLADIPTVSSTYFTFTNSAGLFTVSGEKVITVKIDLANGTTSGKTIAFGVNAAADIVTDATAINGTFPVSGNTMATATVGDLGKLTLANLTDPGTAIDPANDLELWQFRLTGADQKIKITKIKLTVIGTLNAADLANLYLTDGVTQIGSKATGLAADKTVTFDLSASPYEMTAGLVKNVSVKGDIVGGSSRNFYFSVRNAGDVVVQDANYGVSLKVNQSDTFTAISATNTTVISQGTLQITKTSDSPSGNIAKDALNKTLAKFNVKAIGEALKVANLVVRTTVGGALDTDNVDNGKVLLDGAQIGTTKDLDSDATADGDATDDDAVGDDDTTFTFGNQFIVNAGQTRVLEIVGDVKKGAGTSMADNDTILITLETGASNYTRLTSGTTANSPTQAGNPLTVSGAALSTTKNASLANITTIASTQDVIIGSWLITAGAAEGVNVTSVRIVDRTALDAAGAQGIGSAFDVLRLYSGGVKYGQDINSPSTTAATNQTFSLSTPLKIAAGQSVQVDLKVNVLSSAAWVATNTIKINQVVGIGQTTSQTVTDSTGANGQQITISSAGTLTIARESAPTDPASTLVVTSTSNATMGAWKFTAGLAENLTVTRIKVKEVNADDRPGAVKNLKLFVSGSQVGATIPALTTGSPDYGVFEDAAGLFTVPKAATVTVVLKADINNAIDTFLGTTVTNGINVQFRISNVATHTASTDVSAKGASSGTYVTGTAADYTANPMKIVMTKPAFACVSTGSGGCDSAQKTLVPGTTEVLRFKITADSMNDVIFDGTNHNIRFTIVSSITDTAARTFSLYDAATNTTVATDVSVTPSNGATVNFATALSTTIPKNELKTFYVETNLAGYTATGASFQLKAMNAADDLSWSDGSGALTGQTVDISDAYIGKGLPIYGGILVKPGS